MENLPQEDLSADWQASITGSKMRFPGQLYERIYMKDECLVELNLISEQMQLKNTIKYGV